MKKSRGIVLLCGAAMVCVAVGAQTQQLVSANATGAAGFFPGDVSTLPPLPSGKSTVLGGQIRDFDPVRDQFSLRIYGQRPMKILFDERTQVYRDGVKIPVRELGPEDHASVQTTLDGADVFAVSIHILSGTPEGECDGKVLRFDVGKGELEVASSLSPTPIRLFVPTSASITRVGEPKFTAEASGISDLVPGSLISASFESGTTHHHVATQIKVLAVPGAVFEFSGNVAYLDMQSGIMVLVDPRDGKSYQIRFDSARFPASKSLRPDANVSVKATYDGTQYAANTIAVN